MKPLPMRRCTESDRYDSSSPEICTYRENDGSFTRFTRTGITPPGFPNRPCYGLVPFTIGDPNYVYENGRLWPSAAWCDFYVEHGKTQAEMEATDE